MCSFFKKIFDCFYQINCSGVGVPKQEESSLSSPLNLSTKGPTPKQPPPTQHSTLKSDFPLKSEPGSLHIKREADFSDLKSPRTPSPPTSPEHTIKSKLHHNSPSPSLQTDILSHHQHHHTHPHHPPHPWGPGHARLWSPAEDQRRIWSPAVTCEEENKLSTTTNNNNISSSKVVVEVRCGGCGDVTSQFRPDVSRCNNCLHPAATHRPERVFEVKKKEVCV